MIWSVNEHLNIFNLDNVAHLTTVFVGISSDTHSGSDSGFKMLITAGGKKCMTNDLDGWVVSKCHNWKQEQKFLLNMQKTDSFYCQKLIGLLGPKKFEN